MLTEMKRKGTSYKKFAQKANIRLKKLYECSSPRGIQTMSDEFAEEIVSKIQQYYPSSYQNVMVFYGSILLRQTNMPDTEEKPMPRVQIS